MNNEKYNQIIDEVYKNWIKESWNGRIYPNKNKKKQFINRIKTDTEFSERWGLKIEERKLSQWERVKLLQESWKNNGIGAGHEEVSTLWVEYNNLMTKYNIPTKLTTVSYNNEKIEFYE